MRPILSAVLFAAVTQVAGAQTPAPQATGPILTLDEAIALALRNNPVYLQSGTARARAGAQLRSARGALLPNLSTNFSSDYREGRQQLFAGQTFGSESDIVSSGAGINLNAQYSLADFLGPKQSRASLDAAESDVRASAQNLRAQVVTQYLNVLQAQARAQLQDTLLVSAQAQLDLARARQAVGAANTLDVRRAEVTVGQQQVAILRERNNVQVEMLRLFQQMGVTQPSNVQLVSSFPVTEPKLDLDQLLDMGKKSNPTLNALRSREHASNVGVSRARAAWTPTLQLQTGVSGFAQQLRDLSGTILSQQNQLESSKRSCLTTDSLRVGAGLPSILGQCNTLVFTPAMEAQIRDANAKYPFSMTRNPVTFSAQISLPLFDGFQREQRIQEASAARNDARYNTRAQELRLIADVTSAHLNLVTAYQTVRLQEQNQTASREALALAQERFRVGASTYIELSQARSDFERAGTDLINAIYDFHKAYAALEGAVGRTLR
jgi:outer membrane protein